MILKMDTRYSLSLTDAKLFTIVVTEMFSAYSLCKKTG